MPHAHGVSVCLPVQYATEQNAVARWQASKPARLQPDAGRQPYGGLTGVFSSDRRRGLTCASDAPHERGHEQSLNAQPDDRLDCREQAHATREVARGLQAAPVQGCHA
jgi:hypothetical protein